MSDFGEPRLSRTAVAIAIILGAVLGAVTQSPLVTMVDAWARSETP